jgi:hypothetical protein
MRPEPRPYQIAEVCYNPTWPETPWYVTRTGTVAEQGGFNLGTETSHFKTVQEACSYLSIAIAKDLKTIKEVIKEKESENA